MSKVLQTLDQELGALGTQRKIILCGGSALITLNIIDRRTRDMDVLSPKIDLVLEMAAEKVAERLGLSAKWLNNGPESLATDLAVGWEARTVEIFNDGHLKVHTLGRVDLLATKCFAFCDREDDFPDVLKMQPTHSELKQVFDWVMARDASPLWPSRVRGCFKRLEKELGHGEAS